MSTRKVTQLTFWPEGCDPDDYEAINFMVTVEWRGADRYAVMSRGTRLLSRAGNWKMAPLPMQRRQYRFSYDEAVAAAEKAVEGPLVGGMTWGEFQVWRDAKRAATT